MKSIKEVDIASQTRILVRCDLDVPLGNGKVEDTFRLDHLLPTLNLIKDKGGISIICGHLDRPGGVPKEEFSTKHLEPYFESHLVKGNYELLENLRFTPGERENSKEFAEGLASKADIYVNESFANAHRVHASIVGVPELLPSYAGLRLIEEVSHLEKIIGDPERPLVAVIGGGKVETKKPAVKKFLELADKVLVGGKIGLDWDEEIPGKLVLPLDYAGGGKDIGPKTIALFGKELERAKTVVWSGPMGVFEDPEFSKGTESIGEAIVKSGAFSLVGGGDTISALHEFNLFSDMGFVSIGGGAMLEFLVKGNLPGLEVLGYRG